MKFKFLARSILFASGITPLLISQSYAHAYYNVYIKNKTQRTIQIQSLQSKCIDEINGLPLSIPSGEQRSFTFKDSDGLIGGCHNSDKNLVLYAFYTTSNNVGNAGGDITIDHNEVNDQWASKITTSSTYGGFSLTSAECDENNCLNAWYYISGDFSYNLTIGLTGSVSLSNIKAIGLGEVSITNGFGKPAGQNGSLDLSQGPFVIRFSTSAKACTFNGGLLKCDPGIIYTYSNDNLIFMCQQTADGQAKCPWLLESDGNGDTQYHANIYGR